MHRQGQALSELIAEFSMGFMEKESYPYYRSLLVNAGTRLPLSTISSHKTEMALFRLFAMAACTIWITS